MRPGQPKSFLQRLYAIIADSPNQAEIERTINESIHNGSGDVSSFIFKILEGRSSMQLSPAEILRHLSNKRYGIIIRAAEQAVAAKELLAEWKNF